MRQDQIEALKPDCERITDKILVAILGPLGVNKSSDVIPNTQEFFEEMVKITWGTEFTEEDIDEVINFNNKFKNKTDLGTKRSEQFIEKYFKENEKVMQAMLDKLQGE